MRPHINQHGQFQSDKYPTCPPGKVPLSVTDTTAQDLLWEYAQRRRAVDRDFADDLETVLRDAGHKGDSLRSGYQAYCVGLETEIARLRAIIETKAAIDRSSLSPTRIARNEALAQAAEIAEHCAGRIDNSRVGDEIAYRIRALIEP